MADAAVKIQKVYRGFQTRKHMDPLRHGKKSTHDNMSDLKSRQVADVAVKIQKVSGGFQSRKDPISITKVKVDERDTKRTLIKKKMKLESTLEEKPSEELLRHPGDVVAAAITLQRFFRYFI